MRRNPTAYHGSGARFTAFTTDGVGKGHGIGYGWGIYLTADQPTAGLYAGAGGNVYRVRIPRGPWMPWSGRTESPSIRRVYKKIITGLRHVTEPCSTHGTRAAGEEEYQHLKDKDFNVSGGYLYRSVAQLLDDHVGDKTSRLLRSHGIIGIVYEQPMSRLKDGSITSEGATNYVVFDPKDIVMKNPKASNTGWEFKQAAARRMLVEAIDLAGGNVGVVDSLIDQAFAYAKENWQKYHRRILPVKEYPALRHASTLQIAKMAAELPGSNPRQVFRGSISHQQSKEPKRITGLRSGKDIKLACRVGGITFYIVNGPKIRKQWADFLSGHHLAYDFIPKTEIWIDDTIANREWPGYVAAHELIELLLMNYKGWPYEKAHNAANVMEQEMRRRGVGHSDEIMAAHFIANLGDTQEIEDIARSAAGQFIRHMRREN